MSYERGNWFKLSYFMATRRSPDWRGSRPSDSEQESKFQRRRHCGVGCVAMAGIGGVFGRKSTASQGIKRRLLTKKRMGHLRFYPHTAYGRHNLDRLSCECPLMEVRIPIGPFLAKSHLLWWGEEGWGGGGRGRGRGAGRGIFNNYSTSLNGLWVNSP